jgi:hypothetical protein
MPDPEDVRAEALAAPRTSSLGADFFERLRAYEDPHDLAARSPHATRLVRSGPFGWAYDVYIGSGACPQTDRPGRWASPFEPGRNGTPAQAAASYRHWLWERLRGGALSIDELARLDGKDLGYARDSDVSHGPELVQAARWAASVMDGVAPREGHELVLAADSLSVIWRTKDSAPDEDARRAVAVAAANHARPANGGFVASPHGAADAGAAVTSTRAGQQRPALRGTTMER